MLSEYNPMPTLPTSDLERAKTFYEQTLGFSPGQEGPEGLLYTVGSARVLVYQSEYAGTNRATAMALSIPGGAFDSEVAALRAAGITFDTFDLPGEGSWDDGVASFGEGRAAWFHDPDGNIIAPLSSAMG